MTGEPDLNSDSAEGFDAWRLGDDDALLDAVSSANVAGGFHPVPRVGGARCACTGTLPAPPEHAREVRTGLVAEGITVTAFVSGTMVG